MVDKEKKRALRLDLRINSLGFSESGKRQRHPRLHCCMETLSSFFKPRPKIPIYETNPQICCSTFISPQRPMKQNFFAVIWCTAASRSGSCNKPIKRQAFFASLYWRKSYESKLQSLSQTLDSGRGISAKNKPYCDTNGKSFIMFDSVFFPRQRWVIPLKNVVRLRLKKKETCFSRILIFNHFESFKSEKMSQVWR